MTTRYLYIMGAGSGAGKSTVCLGILAQLLASGYAAEQLAYIKPVTQCIAKQPVALFCEHNKIACVDIGALVFKKGFSRDFIAGLTKPAAQLLTEVIASILSIGKDKSVVVIDGIGHPAVGSVVGVSNVDVALALPCKVVFVSNPGIGAAIDNTVLCVSFMQYKGLTDIGIIYNNIPLNAYADIKTQLTKRLPELLPTIPLLGFIGADEEDATGVLDNIDENNAQGFSAYVDRKTLLCDWFGLTDVYKNLTAV
ncbi:MAG: AAA family ATPase [Methylococcaceae bacterium]|nr:AAA family ATPase [Methylococcaceae bacterium]